jgi:manganese/zinc/iron transport system permease protein
MLGAAMTVLAATLVIIGVTTTTRVPYDSALALMLSSFFGGGLVLLTYLQQHAGAAQAGLDSFLFGQAAALVERDVLTMGVLGSIALLIMLLFWKEFKLLAFDPDFGRSLGVPVRLLDVLLTTLLVIAIVIGLQTVGVVLMSAVVVAPAAAARQWTDRLGTMVMIAAGFGAVSGASGALISGTTANLPTGPTIVLCMGIIVVGSLLVAPNRGLLWRWWRQRRTSRQLRREQVLHALYTLARKHAGADHPHEPATLDAMVPGSTRTEYALQQLAEEGLVTQTEDGQWYLTKTGTTTARTLAEERNLIPDANSESS